MAKIGQKLRKPISKGNSPGRNKTYKKLDYSSYIHDSFERKPYFYRLNLEGVRSKFRIVSKMVETVRENFPSKYRNMTLQCQSCKDTPSVNTLGFDTKRDSQQHLLEICPTFNSLRDKVNLDNDEGIIEFFKGVIAYRIEHWEV